jgi:hypothetical protein
MLIIHCANQKQLHRLPKETYEEDLVQAENCLSVLAFCGSVDRVAQNYFNQLTELIYIKSLELMQRCRLPIWRLNPKMLKNVTALKTGDYLLAKPANGDSELLEVSSSLLHMLCSLFCGKGNGSEVDEKTSNGWTENAILHEHIQMAERLHWNLESSMTFRWNISHDDNETLLSRLQSNLPASSFLESMEPNGWSSSS